ncbi:MAG TPA: phage major capsid protein [Acidobacteriaceae bacterium]|nr:phage major capsid protein [Acidobacteriaceae bacterium]
MNPRLPETTRYSGVIHKLSAAEAQNVDERGIPKKLGRLQRKASVAGYDKETRTVTMAVSSSTPVERWFGQEILSHEKGAVRTDRLKGGVSLLYNHDYDQLLGRSQSFELGDPIRVTSRFGTSALATEKEADVEADILVDVSIGYIVHEWEITEDKNGVRTYLAVDWELLEVSLVTVPADPTVGVGRDAKDAQPVKVRSFRKVDDQDADDTDNPDDEDEDDEDEDERALSSTGNAGQATNETVVGVPAAAREVSAPTTSNPNPTSTRTGATMAEPTTTTAGPDLAAQNQERLSSLRTLHSQYPNDFNERSLKAAEDLGVSVESVKARIADAIIANSQRSEVPTVADELFDGMSAKERSQYSIVGAYRAAVNARTPGTFKGKGQDGGFEREVGETLRKKAEERGITGLGSGIAIPSSTTRSVAQQRAIAAGGNAGTATNITQVEPDPIELLRSRTVCLALGARMMTGLHGAIQMPRQSGAASSNWLAEGGSATESDPTLNSILMTPKRLSMQNAYYLDFLAQSALAVDSFLADDRLQVLTRSLDTAGLAGSGVAPVPKGLLNQTGLAAVLAGTTRASNGTVTAGLGGVPLTFVDVNNLEAAISTVNGDIGTLRWASTPKVRAAGRSTPQIPGSAVSGFLFPNSKVGPNGLQEGPLGYDGIATSNAALTGFSANSVNNLHAFILGVWDQMLFGDWGLSEVIADPYTNAASALYTITEHAFYDTNVRHIESFAACTSALPS